MATDAKTTPHPETPVRLTTHREGPQNVVYELNIHNETRQQVLDAYDADNVDDLASQHTKPGREVVDVRLGVIAGRGDDATFHTDHDLLKRVDGVTDTLAAAFVNEYGDLEQFEHRLKAADVWIEPDATPNSR
ncbi:uncharacterized protein HHUB_4156 (plasmid) [Halobacterium hubeiense]|uniref:Uncharacterized protein n=1 Tax=Halobacterium hubeiense TaxID=1407499 RepID=A0A0U5H791_9EURY|nr:hypothetical protein [Halobacterium hubeiense]CQH63685.1 uncharacterized protein HHUB_4156 [Halobacterium hubeiense]